MRSMHYYFLFCFGCMLNFIPASACLLADMARQVVVGKEKQWC